MDAELTKLESSMDALHKLAEAGVVARERSQRVQTSTVNAVASMWQRLNRIESIIYEGIDPAREPTQRPPPLPPLEGE